MSAFAASPGVTGRASPSALPRSFWIARAITTTTGLGLHLAGLYAALVTFGAWITVALYAVGGLAAVLQHSIVRRGTSCSPGE